MCNINIAYVKTEHQQKYNELLNTITFNSFLRNSDGEGYISIDESHNVTTLKSKHKIIFDTHELNFKLMAIHERMATSGLNEEYIHPHETADLILIHNGVFNGLSEGEKSDTRIYTERLQTEYSKHGDLIKAIQDLNADVSGSYSILVLNKTNNKVYYFKESSTSFYSIENDDVLIMSTSKENAEYSKAFLNITAEIKSVEPLNIYDVFDGFNIVATFKEKERLYATYCETPYSWYYKNTPSSKKSKHKEIRDVLKQKFKADISKYDDDEYKVYIPHGYLNDVLAYFEHFDVLKHGKKSTLITLKTAELETFLSQFKKPKTIKEAYKEDYGFNDYNDYDKTFINDISEREFKTYF